MRCATASSRTDRRKYHGPMPLYVIERKFADQLDLTADDVRAIDAVNADEGVSWLFSFITADKLRHLLPLRGTVARRDHGGGAPGERARGQDRRGEQVRARRDARLSLFARRNPPKRIPPLGSSACGGADP